MSFPLKPLVYEGGGVMFSSVLKNQKNNAGLIVPPLASPIPVSDDTSYFHCIFKSVVLCQTGCVQKQTNIKC